MESDRRKRRKGRDLKDGDSLRRVIDRVIGRCKREGGREENGRECKRRKWEVCKEEEEKKDEIRQ